MGIATAIAKSLMKLSPSRPSETDLSFWEIFRHERYTRASPEQQEEIRLASAQFRYDYERGHCLLDRYFGAIPREEFRGKTVLDFGSFTGGRIVYWKEHFHFGETKAFDINPLFEEAGRSFARQKGVDVDFTTAFGEALPYASDYFDLIISYDVFEHVRDLEKVMDECWRVLKPGGRLLVVFPQYRQILESHLGLVTRVHGLHLLFSGSTLAAAGHEIHAERGPAARWYAFDSPRLEPWERSPSLNGTSLARFRRILRKHRWVAEYQNRAPLLSSGRRADRPVFKALRSVLAVPARLPWLEELFLDRICFVLRKDGPESSRVAPATMEVNTAAH